MKKKISKRFKKLLEISKNKKVETLEEAIKKIKNNCSAKFDESIDISLNLNLSKKKEEVGLRTVVNLPHGIGKKIIESINSGRLKEPWFFLAHTMDLHFPIVLPNEYDSSQYGENTYDKQISSIDSWLRNTCIE